jgi:hypothetical protein
MPQAHVVIDQFLAYSIALLIRVDRRQRAGQDGAIQFPILRVSSAKQRTNEQSKAKSRVIAIYVLTIVFSSREQTTRIEPTKQYYMKFCNN